jgi:hypothetical protein
MAQVETKAGLATKYQEKGAQKETYKEYLARREQEKNKEFKIPKPVQYVLLAPVVLLCIFGVFFIPYLMITAKSVPAKTVSESK